MKRKRKRVLPVVILFLFVGCTLTEQNERPSDEIQELPANETELEEVHYDFRLDRVDMFELPDGFDFDGTLFDGYYWEDLNGTNYLFRSIEEPHLSENTDDDNFEYYDQTLHAYHYLEQREDGKKILLRALTDFVKKCGFDINCSFIDDVELFDIDQDEIGEVVFGYRLGCASDVSPSEQKVALFEFGEKYMLRGQSMVMGEGGDYEPGDEFEDCNPDFLELVGEYWEKNKVEYE